MELIIILFTWPILDGIPKLFGFKGLIDWYCEKYNKYADDIFGIYILLFALEIITAYNLLT